eukprot:211719_1
MIICTTTSDIAERDFMHQIDIKSHAILQCMNRNSTYFTYLSELLQETATKPIDTMHEIFPECDKPTQNHSQNETHRCSLRHNIHKTNTRCITYAAAVPD